MDKFNRNYSLQVQTNAPIKNGIKSYLTIQLPFTVEFNIIRNQLSSANTSSIKIYNLSKENRNSILKDKIDYSVARNVELRAAYGDPTESFPVIFSGFISRCWSVREGTDFITQIESFDGGYAYTNAKESFQFKAGTSQQTIILTVARSLNKYGVKLGAVGFFGGSISKGNSYSGNPINILNELTGNTNCAYIDNGRINVLQQNEAEKTAVIPVINSASGLLGTPVREETYLNFEILFDPQLQIGQLIRLESNTGNNYNNFYTVVSLEHRGTISSSVCGSAITRVGVFLGTESFKQVAQS